VKVGRPSDMEGRMTPPALTPSSSFALSILALGLALGGTACTPETGGGTGTDDDESGTTSSGSSDEGSTSSATASTSSASVDDTTTGGETDAPEVAGVRVLRDAHGVPHVIADTDAGALYGLGWASAEDRLAQMHITVLSAQGRLAEHFGVDHVQADVRVRVMGTWRHAERMADALPSEHRALLDAYAQGVADWAAAHPEAVAAALDPLGIELEAWSAAHSLAVWYRISDLFTNDPVDKALMLEEFEVLVGQVGLPAAIQATLGTLPPGQPEAAVVQAADVPDDVEAAIADYAASMGYGGAAMAVPHDYGHVTPKFSHAWAVAGERTTTGAAALVSDPQVAVSSPNFLYEWAVVGSTLHARGAGPAGIPALLIGFTPQVAWGLTASGVDQRDLFRLQMTDATHYLVDGVEHELTVESETVLVAGGSARQLDYAESVWGPVVTSLLPPGVAGEYAQKGLPFAVTDRDPFMAVVAMMRASDLDELRAALTDWTTPAANLVAAGPDGHVFYTLVGDIPLRSPDSPLGGMIAQDGSSTAFDWVDLIPNDFKPWVLDPAAGYILTANHRPVADWYPLPLGVGQGGGGDTMRSRRLRELLAALPATVEPEAVLDDVQWDCANAGRRDLVALAAHVHALQPGRLSPSTVALLDALADWLAAGGSMHTEQVGVFLADHISLQFRVQQTGPALNAQFGGGETGLDLFLDTMMAAVAADPSFLPSDDAVDYLDATLTQAWDATNAQEPDPGQWDALYADTVASPSYAYLVGFDLSVSPVDGVRVDAPTLACADGSTIWSQRGETYTQYVDLAAVDGARTVLPPGNSGVPDTDAFTSQLEPWAEGQPKATALSVAAIEALAVEAEELEGWGG
jgi:penicillin G amidase